MGRVRIGPVELEHDTFFFMSISGQILCQFSCQFRVNFLSRVNFMSISDQISCQFRVAVNFGSCRVAGQFQFMSCQPVLGLCRVRVAC